MTIDGKIGVHEFKISTPTSRVGCDAEGLVYDMFSEEFLLTHPVWDVTLLPSVLNAILSFLLTHPVWDVTPAPSLPIHSG